MKQPNPKLIYRVGFIVLLIISIPLLYTNQMAFKFFVLLFLVVTLLYTHVFSSASKERRQAKEIIKKKELKSLEHMTNDHIIFQSIMGALVVILGIILVTGTIDFSIKVIQTTAIESYAVNIFLKTMAFLMLLITMHEGFSTIYSSEIEKRPASLKYMFNKRKEEFEQIFFGYQEEKEVQTGFMMHALEVASKFNRWVEVRDVIIELQREKLELTEKESLRFEKTRAELEQLKEELQSEKQFLLDSLGIDALEVSRTKYQSNLIKKMTELEK